LFAIKTNGDAQAGSGCLLSDIDPNASGLLFEKSFVKILEVAFMVQWL